MLCWLGSAQHCSSLCTEYATSRIGYQLIPDFNAAAMHDKYIREYSGCKEETKQGHNYTHAHAQLQQNSDDAQASTLSQQSLLHCSLKWVKLNENTCTKELRDMWRQQQRELAAVVQIVLGRATA
jgi:hypothetical protein